MRMAIISANYGGQVTEVGLTKHENEVMLVDSEEIKGLPQTLEKLYAMLMFFSFAFRPLVEAKEL